MRLFLNFLTNERTKNAGSIFNDKSKENYLYIWASWCIPCLDFMEQYLKQENKKLIQFISIDQSYENWSKALKKLNAPLTDNWLVQKEHLETFKRRLLIKSVPRIIKLDNNVIKNFNFSKDGLLLLKNEL